MNYFIVNILILLYIDTINSIQFNEKGDIFLSALDNETLSM